MTAWSSFDLAVEAMRRGACDFIQKPWDNDRLLAAIRKQAESERRQQVRAGDRRERPAEALPAQPAPHAHARLCRPVPARARGGRRLLRFSRNHRPHARLRAGRCLGQGRPGGAADGEPAGQLSATSRPARCCGPSDVLGTVNRHFFDSTAAERFATLFFGIYDDRTRRIRYVNCAHCLAAAAARATARSRSWTPPPPCSARFQVWKCKEAAVDLRPRRHAAAVLRRRHRGRHRARRRVRRGAPGATALAQNAALPASGPGQGDRRGFAVQRRLP